MLRSEDCGLSAGALEVLVQNDPDGVYSYSNRFLTPRILILIFIYGGRIRDLIIDRQVISPPILLMQKSF